MYLLCSLLRIYTICFFVRIILSWFPLAPGGAMATIHDFLVTITDPVLAPIRRVIPPIGVGGMGLDLSPIIALLLLQIVVGGLILGC